MNDLPRIEGTGARIIPGTDSQGRQRKRPNAADMQAAIDHAGEAYRARFGRPPSHVALPSNNTIALDVLSLYTLSLAHPSGPGVVIVGRPIDGNGTPPAEAVTSGTQLELFNA